MVLDSLFRRFAFAPLPVPQDWFAIPLRLIVGYGFLEHGYAKLARGPDVFIGILHAIGMPFAFFLGWATIVIEVVGGLLILLSRLISLTNSSACRVHVAPTASWTGSRAGSVPTPAPALCRLSPRPTA
jgi:hypothetical protein